MRFDDPTTGFFLRKTNAIGSNAMSSASVSASVGSTLGVASPTTSIILGTSGSGGSRNELKEKGKLDFHEKSSISVPTSSGYGWPRPASPVLGDILRSER